MKIFSIKNIEKGFTLIEMMAVLALLAILGTIFMNSGYQETKIRNALLTDSEDVSITIIDMQNRSSSFIRDNLLDTVGYGVFIDLSNPSKIETFYKTKDNNFTSNEVMNAQKPTNDLIFNGGNHISRICFNSDTNYCYNSIDTKMVLFFVKPKPYVNFATYDPNSDTYITEIPGTTESINQVCIEIAPSSSNNLRHIDVSYVGQVSSSYGPCK